MTSSQPANYRTIPPSEDHANASDSHEDGGAGDEWQVEHGAKWIYFVLGCAILLPWNALTNSMSFFLSRVAGSPYYPTISSYLASVYTLGKLFFQFYCTLTSRKSSASRRIFASMSVTVVLVALLFTSTFIRGTAASFVAFSLLVAAAMAVTNSYLTTAVMAGAAILGPEFLKMTLAGQSAIAVVVSVVQLASAVISLWGSKPSTSISLELFGGNVKDSRAEDVAARIFFGVATLFVLVSLFAYAWLQRQPFYRQVTSPLEGRRREIPCGEIDERTGLVADNRPKTQTQDSSRFFKVLKQNAVFMFCISYSFLVTLSVYPAITARVQSVDPRIHPMLFTAVHFVIQNSSDLLGRLTCSRPFLAIWDPKKILVLAFLRTVFVPLILLCNVYRPTATNLISPVINSDVLYMLIIFCMGYSHGYVTTLAILGASSPERNPGLKGGHEDVDIVAAMSGSFVMVGLASGALASFGVQALI
ncbi:nucleoside transporter-domain-containing protein [Chiua virens]|nr:nucleoside transporter-domain-containing protein [Chiua virens]